MLKVIKFLEPDIVFLNKTHLTHQVSPSDFKSYTIRAFRTGGLFSAIKDTIKIHYEIASFKD